jgi:nucleotide-binding universal stress UspA family protein
MDTPFSGRWIVVGIDNSAGSRAAEAWAIEEARTRACDLEAVFACPTPKVYPSMYFSAPTFALWSPEAVLAEGRRVLADAFAKGFPGDVGVHLSAVQARAVVALRSAMASPDSQLLVVGRRGHAGVTGLHLGSVSHALTHHLLKPLVIVPTPASASTADHKIVVGVDGSPHSAEALRWAADEAQRRAATLEVVVTWSRSLPGSRLVGTELAATDIVASRVGTLDPSDLEVLQEVREGSPAAVLLERAESTELLVVGTRGHGRTFEAVLGSVSHTCVHQSNVPVAIIPVPRTP